MECKDPPRKSAASLRRTSERIHSRNALPNNKRVDVVCALVSLHRFQVHHVAHEWVFVSHTIRAENVARHTGTFERHPYIISLGHGNMLRPGLVLILQSPYLQH